MEAPTKLRASVAQLSQRLFEAVTNTGAPSRLTSARLPRNLRVRKLAHSATLFCGHAQPQKTVPATE